MHLTGESSQRDAWLKVLFYQLPVPWFVGIGYQSRFKDRCVAHEPNTDLHMFFTLYIAGRDSGGRVHGCSRCAKCMPFTGVRAHVIRCKCDVSSRQLEMVYRSEGRSQNGHQQRESRCRGCWEDVTALQAIWQLREHRCALKVGCRGRRHHRVAGSH